MTDSVDPDETEQSHLDLHCLHRYLFWSARLKGLPHYRVAIGVNDDKLVSVQ